MELQFIATLVLTWQSLGLPMANLDHSICLELIHDLSGHLSPLCLPPTLLLYLPWGTVQDGGDVGIALD